MMVYARLFQGPMVFMLETGVISFVFFCAPRVWKEWLEENHLTNLSASYTDFGKLVLKAVFNPTLPSFPSPSAHIPLLTQLRDISSGRETFAQSFHDLPIFGARVGWFFAG